MAWISQPLFLGAWSSLFFCTALQMSRGNHETVNMNQVYGFDGEVKAKSVKGSHCSRISRRHSHRAPLPSFFFLCPCRYNPQMSEFFNQIFNWLPLAHVINNKIFVVHGGLFSSDDVTLDELRKIDRNRQPPDSGPMSGVEEDG